MNYDAFIANTLADLMALPETDVLSTVFANPYLKRQGQWLEFGVWEGRSLRRLAAERGGARVWGFDSFRGLPEDWREGHPKGHFGMDHVPFPPDGANLVVGLFDETLSDFHPEDVWLLHIDCDLYRSAQTVLDYIDPRQGMFIVFDELFKYDGFENGEMEALYEWVVRENPVYEWVARGKDGQAAMVIR